MADLTPDQGGGPTWGNIAIPQQLGVYSPGLQVMGGLAADTAFSAKRAQNLAAFNAFQELNPNASAADLSAAAEHITGGDSLLGGSFTPAVMADIANKNRLKLQATQAKEQGDITAGYMTAMEQAINTADTPEDWVQKTKSLMPQSSWGTFDSYIGGKNTVDMFRVYQQRRVTPIVKDGVAYMWDTLEEYTTAAGGNKTLGQMAMDLAKPSVDALKAEGLDKHNLNQAQILAQQANAEQSRASAAAAMINANANREQSHAAALNSEAERLLNLQRAANAKIDANKDMVGFLDKTMDDTLVQSGVGSGDAANQGAAYEATLHKLIEQYGDTPEVRLAYENWKKDAPASVAATTSARINALNQQTAQLRGQEVIEAPTAGVVAQYGGSKDTALNALNPADFEKLSKEDQDKFRPLAVSKAQNILADKNLGVTDTELFNKIVADGAIAGKSPDEIRDILKNTISPRSGLPVADMKIRLQDKINSSFQPAAPMNEPAVKKQLDDLKAAAVTSMDNMTKTLKLPVGQGGSVAEIRASYEAVKQENDKALYYMQRTLSDLKDRNRQGMYWEKDSATQSYLERQIHDLQDRGKDLRRLWESRKDLKAEAEATGAAVTVNGSNLRVTTDLNSVAPGSENGVISTVQNIENQNANTSRRDPGTGGKLANVFDPDFLPFLQANPAAARLVALTAQEVNRLDRSLTLPKTKSYAMGAGGYDPKATPTLPSPLTDAQIGQVVDQIIRGNLTALPWTDAQRGWLKAQTIKLMTYRSK